jgi:hypothetical protein
MRCDVSQGGLNRECMCTSEFLFSMADLVLKIITIGSKECVIYLYRCSPSLDLPASLYLKAINHLRFAWVHDITGIENMISCT